MNYEDQDSREDFIDQNDVTLFEDANGFFLGLGGSEEPPPDAVLMPAGCM